MAAESILSKSVRKELLPVSTRPPTLASVTVFVLISDGINDDVCAIELFGPPAFLRRRIKANNPAPMTAAPPTPAMIGKFSITVSINSGSGGGGGGTFGASGFLATGAAGAGTAAGTGGTSVGLVSAGDAVSGAFSSTSFCASSFCFSSASIRALASAKVFSFAIASSLAAAPLAASTPPFTSGALVAPDCAVSAFAILS